MLPLLPRAHTGGIVMGYSFVTYAMNRLPDIDRTRFSNLPQNPTVR